MHSVFISYNKRFEQSNFGEIKRLRWSLLVLACVLSKIYLARGKSLHLRQIKKECFCTPFLFHKIRDLNRKDVTILSCCERTVTLVGDGLARPFVIFICTHKTGGVNPSPTQFPLITPLFVGGCTMRTPPRWSSLHLIYV